MGSRKPRLEVRGELESKLFLLAELLLDFKKVCFDSCNCRHGSLNNLSSLSRYKDLE